MPAFRRHGPFLRLTWACVYARGEMCYQCIRGSQLRVGSLPAASSIRVTASWA